jgi:threonine/homoserine/homoserine lactone efflux protein
LSPAGFAQMKDILPSWPLLSAFVIASLVLAITPGPGVFYIVTRSIAQGRSAGLASMAGVAVGNLANAIGAAIGLGALFAVSSLAFTVVKYAGAAYLIYLGIQALRPQRSSTTATALSPTSLTRLFSDGFIVALLNPKTALFFAAFLPQFMSASASAIPQSMALGGLFVAIAVMTDTAYVLTASMVAPLILRARGLGATGRYASGSALIGLGLLAAFSGSRADR